MKKTLKSLANLIPYIILLIAFILIISLTVSLKKGETPSILGTAVFYIETDSMEDTIMTGDVIFVDTNYDHLMIGDIITFQTYADLDLNGVEEFVTITHRIVEMHEESGVTTYTTKGDKVGASSNTWEISITEDQIIGKYSSKSAFIGWIYTLIREGGINLLFGVVIIVFVIIGVMEVRTIICQISMAKRKEELEKEKQRLVEIELERLRKEMKEKEN